MVLDQAECPSLDLLTDFAGGQISDDSVFQTISLHLEVCQDCARQLENLDHQDSLVQSLQNAAREVSPFENREGLDKAIQRAFSVVEESREITSQSAGASDDETNFDSGANSESFWDLGGVDLKPDAPVTLGPYRLIEELGRGGMGIVYRGVHTMMNRPVAIKILPFHRTSDSAAKRFEKEIQAVGQLTHPNIVTGYDAGVFEGRYYLAMEMLEGINLSALAKNLQREFKTELTIADACELIRQAGVGLSHAHKAGIVHRDIKPANMMLCEANPVHSEKIREQNQSRESTDVVVKILDMGLARLDLAAGQHLALTATDQLVGTIHYMPAEQCLDVRDVDARSDIYSLGASLFRLLTGHAPWADGSYETKGQILKAIMSDQLPSLKMFRPNLPKPLVDIVDRALKKDPHDRFQTVDEMVKALTPLAQGSDLPKLLSRTRIQDAEELVPTKRPSATSVDGDLDEGAEPDSKHKPAAKPVAAPTRINWLKWIALASLPILALVCSIIWLQTDGGYIRIEHDPSFDVTVEVMKDGEKVDTVEVGKEGKRVWYRSGQYEIRVVSDDQDQLVITGDEFTLTRGDDSHVVSIALKTADEKDKEVAEVANERANDSVAESNESTRQPKSSTTDPGSFQFDPTPAFDSIPIDDEMVNWEPSEEQQAFLVSLEGLSNSERLESVLAKLKSVNDDSPNPDVEMRGNIPVGIGLHSWAFDEIWPLVGLPTLEKLDIADTNVIDYSPLQRLFIKSLKTNTILYNREAEAVFDKCASLKKINGKAKQVYFDDRMEKRAEYESFAANILNLPKQQVLDWIAKELQILNPGFEGKGRLSSLQQENGFTYNELENRCFIWRGIDIRDMSPMRVLPLKELVFVAHGDGAPMLDKLALADLSWLKGTQLEKLNLERVATRDLRPIRSLKLKSFEIRLVRIGSLKPLDQMKLQKFSSQESGSHDLTPLAAMPLESFSYLKYKLPVSLAPLKTSQLKAVTLDNGATDLEPLFDAPLESISARFQLYLDSQTKWLTECPTLKTVNGKPVEGFLREARVQRDTHRRFLDSISDLPIDDQIDTINSHLEGMSRNALTFEVVKNEDNEIIEVKMLSNGPYQRRDAWALLAFPKLKKLTLRTTKKDTDWSALTQLPIEELVLPEIIDDEEVLMGTEVPWRESCLRNEFVFRQIPTLKTINGRAAQEVLDEMNAEKNRIQSRN